MTYTDYDILWNDFAISKFFSLEELSIDIIEAFRSGFGGSSHGCKEFDTNYIEFDAKKCECTYQGRKMNVSVRSIMTSSTGRFFASSSMVLFFFRAWAFTVSVSSVGSSALWS